MKTSSNQHVFNMKSSCTDLYFNNLKSKYYFDKFWKILPEIELRIHEILRLFERSKIIQNRFKHHPKHHHSTPKSSNPPTPRGGTHPFRGPLGLSELPRSGGLGVFGGRERE